MQRFCPGVRGLLVFDRTDRSHSPKSSILRRDLHEILSLAGELNVQVRDEEKSEKVSFYQK